MGKYCQLVMGAAGVGKSTYCKNIQRYCNENSRTVHVVNMDPAAESLGYDCSIDVRNVYTLEAAMDEEGLGPNGGLVRAMQVIISEEREWIQDQLGDYPDDDYLLFDMPGQIELFTHVPIIRDFVQLLQNEGYQIAGVNLVDSHVTHDFSKYVSATMVCLSTMLNLEVPFVSIFSKCDLQPKKWRKKEMEPFLGCEFDQITDRTGYFGSLPPKFQKLTDSIQQVLDDYHFVDYIPLDPTKDSSIRYALARIDECIQYGEDLEPKEPAEDVYPDDEPEVIE